VSELDVRCATVADLGTLYLEDALPAEQRASYETHLVFCTDCVAFLSDLRELRRRLRALPPDPLDAAERRRLLEGDLDG
jgi:anti-sigma factor RsiW